MVQTFLETVVRRLTGPNWALYLAIPLTTGLMGWITNIVALKMTFHPVEFRGIPPILGWQGIIPRKAVKIARQFSRLLTKNLITVRELFEKIDPDDVAEEMRPTFDELIEPTVRETVREKAPSVWDLLPDWSRREIYSYFRTRLPELLGSLPEDEALDLRGNVHDLAERVEEKLGEPIEEIVDEVISNRSPSMWESLPDRIRQRMLREVRNDLPRIIAGVISDWQENIDDIFELESMVVEEIRDNRRILNDVFRKSGRDELTFIKRSGLYFGTLFGLIQMVLWMFYDAWWLLPIAGFLVGVTTNYIAIQLIFSPKQPIRIGPFTLQGLAYKRRGEINETFSTITTDEVLNVRNIFGNIFSGTDRDRLFRILQKQIHVATSRIGGAFDSMVNYVIGPEKYFDIKNDIAENLLLVMPDAMEYSFDYLERELQLKTVLKENLEALSPEEYETIMRTPYKEDEWILILVGGALGAFVGILQLVYLFGGALPFL